MLLAKSFYARVHGRFRGCSTQLFTSLHDRGGISNVNALVRNIAAPPHLSRLTQDDTRPVYHGSATTHDTSLSRDAALSGITRTRKGVKAAIWRRYNEAAPTVTVGSGIYDVSVRVENTYP